MSQTSQKVKHMLIGVAHQICNTQGRYAEFLLKVGTDFGMIFVNRCETEAQKLTNLTPS